jgi:hypothetical protein
MALLPSHLALSEIGIHSHFPSTSISTCFAAQEEVSIHYLMVAFLFLSLWAARFVIPTLKLNAFLSNQNHFSVGCWSLFGLSYANDK